MDRHAVVGVHGRLGLDLDAHVEVLDLLGRDRRVVRTQIGGADDGARYHRHPVAHVHPRLLAVAHPHPRVGQGLGVAVGAQQLELVAGVDADGAAAEVADLRQPRAGAARAGELARVGDAEVAHLGARDFEDLEFEHHLGVGPVLRRDQPLGGADDVGRVAHHQQVDTFVDEDVACLEHRAQQVERLLRVGVAEVEGAHHQLLVLAQLLRRVRVDQHGVVGEDLLFELVVLDQQVERVLDPHVAHEDRGLEVGPDLAVHDEVDAGRTRQRFEHQLERGVAEFERDGFLQPRLQHRHRQRLLALLLAQRAVEFARAGVGRVLGQDCLDHQVGAGHVAGGQPGAGVAGEHLVAARGLDPVQAGAGPRMLAIDAEHLGVGTRRGVELAGGVFGAGQREQAVEHPVPRLEILQASLGVARVRLHLGLVARQAFLVVALFDLGLELRGRWRRAAGRAPQQRQRDQQPRESRQCGCHGETPIVSDCCWPSGR